MAVTILHTADWQLGKPFGSIEGDVAALLREERFNAVARLADLARERQADAVLVAGDVFRRSARPSSVSSAVPLSSNFNQKPVAASLLRARF